MIGKENKIVIIIQNYQKVNWEKKYIQRKIIKCHYPLQKSKILPKGIEFEINTSLVNKLFKYKNMSKSEKEKDLN